MIRKVNKMVVNTVKESSERAARKKLLEELFYDFHRSRGQVYWVNFVRGLFLGFGTIVGGTLVVALIIWILSQMAGWFPGLGDLIRQIIDTIQKSH